MTQLDRFARIKCFVFDVDGVLTDGTLLVLEDGQMARQMNIKDGYALQLAIKKGYHLLVISGAAGSAVKNRLELLGVTDVFFKVTDKKQFLQDYLQKKGISADETLFMGDDIPDYHAMKEAGLPCCPVDAVPEIRQISAYISGAKGGAGCVRDVIEKVLKLRNHWELNSSIASQ
jgi:3-deoxy-D-manno-octulosonate 8-phosphate phosphatase (KDO 8-P phosphatase)